MKLTVTLCLFFCTSMLAVCQESIVYGMYNDENSPYDGYSILAAVDPLTGSLIDMDTIVGFEAVGLGTSSFDQLNGGYRYLAASASAPFSWIERDIVTNSTTSMAPSSGTLNEIQFDMSTGMTYGLGSYVMDSISGFPEYGSTLEQLDITTGQTTLVAEYPALQGIVLGGTTYDPNNGMYYLFGTLQSGDFDLLSIDVSTGQLELVLDFSFGADEYLNELRYDIDSGMFYAIHRNGDEIHLARLDPSLNALTDIVELTQLVDLFIPNASVFHQESGRFILLSLTDAGQRSLITMDVENESVISEVEIDYTIFELQVDNVEFAIANFTSILEFESVAVAVGPNPASEHLNYQIDSDADDLRLSLVDMRGRTIIERSTGSMGSLELEGLATGVYEVIFTSESERIRSTEKVIVRP